MAEMIGILGPPKTGKSHFARSCAEVGKTVVGLLDSTERKFYESAGLQPKVFVDFEWRPRMKIYKATAFDEYYKWLYGLASSDAEFIITDPVDRLSECAMHEVLKMHGSDDPKSAGSHGEAYMAHDRLVNQVLDLYEFLESRGKWVVCVWHSRMKEFEGVGEAIKVDSWGGKDEKGRKIKETKFEDRMLPVLLSNLRQAIAGRFSGWMFTRVTGEGPGTKFYLSAQQDQARPAGARMEFKKGTILGMIPNTMKSLLEVLET